MTKEELKGMILGEIRARVPDGHCVETNVFLYREKEPHHVDTYWDRHMTCLYHYKGHLLYASCGCYVGNLDDVTSLDVLTRIQEGVTARQSVPISDEKARSLDAEYARHWGRREWMSSRHSFRYWLWDGKTDKGPFNIQQEMTLDEAEAYVKKKYRNTKYESFELQEFKGLDDTYYHYGLKD